MATQWDRLLRELERSGRVDRRRFLRLLTVTGLSMAGAGAFAACRGGGTTPTSAPAGTTPAVTPTERPSEGLASVPGYDNPNKWKGKTLVFAGFGGAMQDAQRKAVLEPFARLTGATIVEDTTDIGKLKAMVDAGSVEWTVAQQGTFESRVLGKQGYLEPIDYSIVEKANFFEDVAGEFDVAVIYWSLILAYRTDKFGNNPPQGWADFWNVEKFPGPRAMDKVDGPVGNLEFALLADGVPKDQVYQVLRTAEGVERAFRKLDEIKPHVTVWWEAGAQPAQLLTDGEVDLAQAWNGRIDAAQRQGAPIAIQWNEGLLRTDSFIVPKGVKEKELAMDFINFATRPEVQAELSKYIPYSPTNAKAFDLLPEDLKARLPSAPAQKEKQLLADASFWLENLDRLTEQFNNWLTR
ncbi:polyamine ABC transporter substrate-binding protein [Thermomicrobium sp. 4228-Ro]|uniref:polyamine ABC transporter substrate-binding protein n=1 Tax=Thermomicrobium sp. 4228-Ro TaxID=2993937 RepID=UPI0022496983|nr:polyamine ABC transporter substrate-binding protein [Thermomicrobium sp. 4228-Ro]MCX2726045.1 polyamine ABC transporter substrate-binding protein [Thermomicrobium sp. 4228-Ro]